MSGQDAGDEDGSDDMSEMRKFSTWGILSFLFLRERSNEAAVVFYCINIHSNLSEAFRIS